MNAPRTLPRGATLVGMLVAMVLGLTLLAAAAAVHQVVASAHARHDAAVRLHETGSLALAYIGGQLRRAGYAELTATAASRQPFVARFAAPALSGCARGYLGSLSASAPGGCVADPAGNDALLVRHQALPDPADPHARLPGYLAASGEGADCLGQNPSASGTLVAVNQVRVQSGSLVCLGNGNAGTHQPVFAGVEQLALRYLADIDGDGSADARLAADDPFLSTLPAWERVLAVHVCLQLQSDEPVAHAARIAFTDCRGVARLATDGRLRQVFESVFALPNRLAPAPLAQREGALP